MELCGIKDECEAPKNFWVARLNVSAIARLPLNFNFNWVQFVALNNSQ